MSLISFPAAIKSTLDYRAKLIADGLGLPFLDLDTALIDSEVIESDQPAVCWEFTGIEESPKDPLWLVAFDIGAMTMADPAQYVSLGVVGALVDFFHSNMRIVIRDYTGVNMPVIDLGYLSVHSVGVTPQQKDKLAGFRFISVTARASRVA